jgi:alpha/beta superfamily hydrolase
MDQTRTFTSTLQTITDLHGPAGRLEALLNTAAPSPRYSVLVCHPHPLGGGTMHNKVVYHAMKAFLSLGLPVLRFNFRGTGLSEGTHDHGQGEQDDVKAALDWLDARFHLPILFAGFSFGSYVGMRVCCSDPRVKGAALLGLPVQAEGRDYDFGFLSGCGLPKLFISGTRDQYGPKSQVEAVFEQAASPKQLTWVEGADHFFMGQLEAVQRAIVDWCGGNIPDMAAQ